MKLGNGEDACTLMQFSSYNGLDGIPDLIMPYPPNNTTHLFISMGATSQDKMPGPISSM